MTALLSGAGGIGAIGMGLSGSGAKGWATSADEAIRVSTSDVISPEVSK
ncbi:hypothetical protein [Burkholderia ubonensis]|nr:hypothetical protein [Burkholderia ubonensis]